MEDHSSLQIPGVKRNLVVSRTPREPYGRSPDVHLECWELDKQTIFVKISDRVAPRKWSVYCIPLGDGVNRRCLERFMWEPLHPRIFTPARAGVHHSKTESHRPLRSVALDDETGGCVRWLIYEFVGEVLRRFDHRQAIYHQVFMGPSFAVVSIPANFVTEQLSRSEGKLVLASFALLQEG